MTSERYNTSTANMVYSSPFSKVITLSPIKNNRKRPRMDEESAEYFKIAKSCPAPVSYQPKAKKPRKKKDPRWKKQLDDYMCQWFSSLHTYKDPIDEDTIIEEVEKRAYKHGYSKCFDGEGWIEEWKNYYRATVNPYVVFFSEREQTVKEFREAWKEMQAKKKFDQNQLHAEKLAPVEIQPQTPKPLRSSHFVSDLHCFCHCCLQHRSSTPKCHATKETVVAKKAQPKITSFFKN